jgi:hypothetical protein
MENYDGKIGSIAVGVLKKGLKPTTTSQLVVSDFQCRELKHMLSRITGSPGYWTRCSGHFQGAVRFRLYFQY